MSVLVPRAQTGCWFVPTCFDDGSGLEMVFSQSVRSPRAKPSPDAALMFRPRRTRFPPRWTHLEEHLDVSGQNLLFFFTLQTDKWLVVEKPNGARLRQLRANTKPSVSRLTANLPVLPTQKASSALPQA